MIGITKVAILLTILAAPIIADECSTGSLANIQNKTCDIGILGFNFGAVQAQASSYDNAGMQLPPPLMLNAADFEFTPLLTTQVAFGTLETGYTITSLLGPISLTAPANGYSQAIVALNFSVIPQGGGIDGAGVLGANINVSGQGYGISLMQANDLTPNGAVSARYTNGGYYDTISGHIPVGATAQGSSILLESYNPDGSSVEWVGPSTTFLFFTATPVPEANSIVLLTTAMGVCGLLLRRRASR
jgi:hypothetical protein